MNIERDRKYSPFSLLSDTTQRSPGLIRHYCVHQRAHTRVHSCEIQAQCPSNQPTTMQESYVVSRIHYLLEHSTDRQTPCLPSCKGTASHVRYECTQFTGHHHLLYSNVIPQHPVPLASMSPNHSHQHPQNPQVSPVVSFSPHLKDCPLYSRKLFCFSIFFCISVTLTTK
jgi:hypothetical protein